MQLLAKFRWKTTTITDTTIKIPSFNTNNFIYSILPKCFKAENQIRTQCHIKPSMTEILLLHIFIIIIIILVLHEIFVVH